MGFDFQERKTSLYADLFKLHEIHDNSSNDTMKLQWRSPSYSNNSSTYDSFSSGFTSPYGSELGSCESEEDGEFAAELSRQMAECMLHEEEEKEKERNSVTDQNLKHVLSSTRPIPDRANRTPCIKLKNQSPVGDHVRVSRGGRIVKGAELTQKTEQNYVRSRYWRGGAAGRKGNSGSGMQAVFLSGAGSRNGSSGTGVFLPRVTNDPVQPKKKSGLSTVLIPTRVLEALDLHFKTHSDCAAPPVTTAGSPHHASPRDEWMRRKGQGNNNYTEFQMEAANIDEIHVLPQEWTY